MPYQNLKPKYGSTPQQEPFCRTAQEQQGLLYRTMQQQERLPYRPVPQLEGPSHRLIPQHQGHYYNDAAHLYDPQQPQSAAERQRERQKERQREKNKRQRDAIKELKVLDMTLAAAGYSTPLTRLREQRQPLDRASSENIDNYYYNNNFN